MYHRNALREPGGITLLGEPIDLGKVKVPSCFVSAKEDHIAPWRTVFQGLNLTTGPGKFILGGSGHIAGIINPPAKQKYGYWVNSKKVADPDAWLAGAEHHEGSWWPEWAGWAAQKSGPKVPAREPGCGKVEPIEPAPGSYVRTKVS
jgi:polyhydroxyalkanoate synthase subunit PhaC